MMARWIPNRIHFYNFWHYQNQTFWFNGGNVLFHGPNGSGKSVATAVAVPLLLDGNLDPRRLDPNSSSSGKTMKSLLLGQNEQDYDSRTAYVFWEFIKEDQMDEYLTIGIGFDARRGQGQDVKTLGFVITDGSRMDIDIPLYEEAVEGGVRVQRPITLPRMAERIKSPKLLLKPRGEAFLDKQKEYAKAVNRHLFGFKDYRDYQRYIKTLLSIRSPKLNSGKGSKKGSDGTTIDDVPAILTDALPELDAQILADAVRSMQELDELQTDLLNKQEEQKAYLEINDAYVAYQESVLSCKAQLVLDAKGQLTSTVTKCGKLEVDIEKTKATKFEADKEEAELNLQKHRLRIRIADLRESDISKKNAKLIDLQNTLQQLAVQISGVDARLKAAEKSRKQIAIKAEGKQNELEKYGGELSEYVDDIEEYQEGFWRHKLFWNEYNELSGKQQPEYVRDTWKPAASGYSSEVANVVDLLKDVVRAEEKYLEAVEKHSDIVKERSVLRVKLADEVANLENQCEQYSASLAEWRSFHASLFTIGTDEWRTVASHVNVGRYAETGSDRPKIIDGLNSAKGVLDCARKAIVAEVEKKQNKLASLLEIIDEDIKVLGNERKRVEIDDPIPLREEFRKEARKALTEAGVPYVPLFEVVEFWETISDEEQASIETALETIGALDGLIIPMRSYSSVPESIQDSILTVNYDNLLTGTTLLSYLRPLDKIVNGVSPADVEAVLTSITVSTELSLASSLHEETHSVIINTNTGRVKNGVLASSRPLKDRAEFIGRESRRQHRFRQIEAIDQKIKERLEQRGLNCGIRDALDDEFNQVAEAFDRIPDIQEIRNTVYELNSLEREINKINDKVSAVETLKAKATQEFKLQNEAAKKKCSAVNIDNSVTKSAKDVLQDAIAIHISSKRYAQAVDGLSSFAQSYQSCQILLEQINEQLRAAEQRVEELTGDKESIEITERGTLLRLKDLRKDLVNPEAIALLEELASSEQRLIDIDNEVTDAVRKGATASTLLKTLTKNLKEFENSRIFFDGVLLATKELFHSQATPNLRLSDTADFNYGSFSRKPSGKKAETDLMTVCNNVREGDKLAHIQLTYGDHTDNFTRPSVIDDNSKAWLDNLDNVSRRTVVVILSNGRQFSPSEACNEVDEQVAVKQKTIDDKEKLIFENYFFGEIGTAIVTSISEAKEWVSNVNKTLRETAEQANDPEVLTVRLKWTQIAGSTERLNPDDLVDIIKRRNVEDETGLEKARAFFRTRFEQVKKEAKESRSTVSWVDIAKTLFDYRKWYQFHLEYDQYERGFRVLNSKTSFLSGGQGAVSVFLPLFAAINSHYRKSTMPDKCAKLIAMDEAFAGVDKQYTNILFKVLKTMGINYLLNSQVVTGTYRAVEALSIYNLKNSTNRRLVSTCLMLWNGKEQIVVPPGTELRDGFS